MAASSLPEEGELRVGSVRLPAGRQVRAGGGLEVKVPVAWVTHQAVPDAGRVWAALSDAHQETGLVPFLLGSLDGDGTRPWDTEEFSHRTDPARLDHMDAAEVLTEMWDGEMPAEEDEEENERWAAMRAPFSRQFPGLAPAGDRALSRGAFDHVLGSLPPRRIGLVPAGPPMSCR